MRAREGGSASEREGGSASERGRDCERERGRECDLEIEERLRGLAISPFEREGGGEREGGRGRKRLRGSAASAFWKEREREEGREGEPLLPPSSESGESLRHVGCYSTKWAGKQESAFCSLFPKPP